MAFAVLKFRRGNTPTTTLAEPYFNTDKDTLQIGNNGTTVTLLKTGTNTGSLHLTGDITASNALLSGDITIQGNIILGDSVANDNININAELSGSLIPDAHNTHNLGSNSKRWKNLYAVSASIDDISLPGSGIVSSSQQISNYNTFLEINGDGVFSGSSQVVLNDADKTGFDTADVSENSSYLYYTDTRVKAKLNTEGVISGSSQITDGSGIVSSSQQISNYNTFLEINGDGVISGSSQVNADSITNFDSNVKDKLNADGVISGSTQITNGSGIVSSSEQISNYNTFLEINGDGVVSGSSQITIGDVSGFTNYSSSINQQLDSIHTYTSSLKTAVDVSGQNLTVYGNLTVQGTQTSLNTNDLIVEDKLIAVASGSTTSAQADGAGLFISGANKSITWDDTNSNILINANVSSSVGFEGDGSNLTGITADSVQWTNITSKPSGLVSGSSQIDVTQTTNYGSINQYSDTKVKDKLNVEGVLSGSQQVIDSLPSGVVSGSTQITDSSGIVSSSQQISNYNTFLEINGDGVISGSSQITDGSGIISSSTFVSNEQGAFTASINGSDTNIDLGLETSDSPTFQGLTLTNLSALGSGNQTALISGSGGSIGKRTLGTAAFFNTSASVGDDPNSVPTNQAVNNALIAAGAGDLTEFNPTNTFSPDNTGLVHLSSGTEVGGVRGVQGNIHIQISTGSVHFRDGVKEKLNIEGVISGSANFLNRNGDSVVSSSAQLTSDFDTRYLNTNGDDVVSGSVLRNLDGTGVHSGSQQVVNSLLNQATDFGTGRVSSDNIGNLDGTTTFTGSFVGDGSSLSGVTSYTDADTLAYINSRGVVSGSTQITNGSGIVSSSAQISNYNTFLEIEGDGVVSSSLQINDLFVGTAVSTSLDSRLDSLETDTHTHSNKSNLDSINQDLANNDNVQFANLVLTGDLTVQGTTTTLNTEELTIEDKLLSVASGSLTSAAADGGGFHISGANASITWDNGNSRLAINKSTHFTGDVQATGDVVAYASSDRELKDNIQPISNPLEKINKISGNSFVWNEEKQNIYKGKDYGVIAQEIEEILPELVQTREDGYKAVKYDKIVSLLIEGIKELSKEVVELKNKIGE